MLRGEGNAGKRLGVISKKATLHVRHTFFCAFLCRCFARLQCETSSRNFLVTRFLEECCTCSRSLFFRFSSFSPGISHFVTTATKFSCCSSNKEMSPLFFFFSLSFAGLPPTFSFPLSLSCSIFQICGYDNLSKLIL